MSTQTKSPAKAQNGAQSKASSTAKTANGAEAKKKADIEARERENLKLQTRIKNASVLQEKIDQRSIFEGTLDEVNDALKIQQDGGDGSLTQTSGIRVQAHGDSHSPIVQFNNRALVVDFLEFMQQKITNKIVAINKEINEIEF